MRRTLMEWVEREDAVLVRFGNCGVAGVEIGAGRLCREHADAGGKATIEGQLESIGRDGSTQGKRSDLAESVDTGVGSARSLRQHALSDGTLNGIGECALNGRKAGLNLPAVECGAVVGERELPVRHLLICTVPRAIPLGGRCKQLTPQQLVYSGAGVAEFADFREPYLDGLRS